MMMIAHLLSAGHAVYDLSTIDNHHQSVNNDDDDHHSHSHDYSHHDHSSPWPGSDWTVEMVGLAPLPDKEAYVSVPASAL